MIDAREAVRGIRLSAPDEAEVRRLGEEIAERMGEFDGRPVRVEIEEGKDEDQRARVSRILLALQRKFQEKGWVTQVEPVSDAFGQVISYGVWFAIDPAVLRDPVKPSVPEARFSLRALYEDLEAVFGVGDAPVLPAAPVLSVILGTYERLSLLRGAIRSIRRAVGKVPYEIVVVDGGSRDGSRAWLAGQPDVLLVGERRLEGAVRAFNQAFSLCRGTYVANANDDVSYEDGSLEGAVAYLDAHPEAGQVALALRAEGEAWTVNEVYSSKYYANHGVIRKRIADRIARITGGFWAPVYHTYAADCEQSAWVWRLGHQVVPLRNLRVVDARPDDGLREKNRSRFGVDTKRMYARWPEASLSPDGPEPRVSTAEIARYREEVGRVAEDSLLEAQPEDALEAMVGLAGFPVPEEERRLRRIAPLVRVLDPVEGRFPARHDGDLAGTERVLHVHINGRDAVDQQAGLVRALKGLAGVGGVEQPQKDWHPSVFQREDRTRSYACVRWTDYDKEHHPHRQAAIIAAAVQVKPTLVFMQIQAPGVVDPETIRKIREISPEAVIATWCGDIADCNSPWQTEWQVETGRLVDLVLHSSMTHVRALRAVGIHNAGYLQIGYDEEQYRLFGEFSVLSGSVDVVGGTGRQYLYDVSFLGSRYGGGDPFSSTYRWKSGAPAHDSALRDDVVRKMRDAFGVRFGLFGSGWDNGDLACPVPVTESHTVYQKSRIGLSVSLDNKLECYTSDRLFRILGCGAMLLVKRFPGMGVLGLKHGENCLAFDTPDEAVASARSVLGVGEHPPAFTIQSIAEAGERLARENHTWSVRMRELRPYLDAVRAARKEFR